jgi:2-oxoglutarate dehydrogenase E2 component (dihydrolipoamide succinyltransferase)
MSAITPVIVPLDNVNDESVVILGWRVAEGAPVEPGQAIVDIETSKASVQIEAPARGFIRLAATPGQELAIGAVICYIVESADTAVPRTTAREGRTLADTRGSADPPKAAVGASAALANSGPAPTPTAAYAGPPRFSAGARGLLATHGLAPDVFMGRGLVRKADILAHVESAAAAAQPHDATPRLVDPVAASEAGPVPGVPGRAETLPRRKRTEAKHIAAGQVHALPSAVIVPCATRGLRAAAQSHAGIHGNATAILIFETARLLRKYPAFNAFCAGGHATFYDEVNIGFAVDVDHGLKVPVLRHADRKTIAQIAEEMHELVVAYLNDTLAVESLSGATFTVTDLSGEGVFSFAPLINRGQSAILGVGSEFFAPGNREGIFNLILAFDHQLGEGRSAARFLNELKQRLGEYETALMGDTEEIVCAGCYRSATALAAVSHHLVPTVRANGATRLLCTRCLDGW